MTLFRWAALAALGVALPATDLGANAAAGRQYYEGTWTYNPATSYHYQRYYYKPVVTAPTYSYHYIIHVPAKPRYVYYYNPVRKVYWGRYDVEDKGYSLLKDEDRKELLKDIPETAFPKPAAMPKMPEADDDVKMDPPPLVGLPKK